MDIIRLREGNAVLVRQALLNREAVILPVRIRNHKLELDWDLVRSSTALTSLIVTDKVQSAAF